MFRVVRGVWGLVGMAAVALGVGFPGVASAAVTWTLQSVPLPAGAQGGELPGVSCPASTFCVATDSAGGSPGGSSYPVPAIEVWDGTAWTAQTLPLPAGTNTASVNAVSCSSAVSCVAIGSYPVKDQLDAMLAEIWNGTTWTPQTIPQVTVGYQDGALYAISCASAASCTAAGSFYARTDPPRMMPLAEHWNGSTWAMQAPVVLAGATSTGLLGISCPTAATCTAVGSADGSTDVVPAVEDWSDGTWKAETVTAPSGATGSALSSVSCTSQSACFAAGSYSTATVTDAPMAMRSKQGSWSNQVTALPSGGTSGELSGISCVKAPGGISDCTAAGYFIKGTDTQHRALAEYWNGNHWTSQQTATPPSGKTLEAISCSPGASICEATGFQLVQGNTTDQLLAERN
jgi:hypothetical protein